MTDEKRKPLLIRPVDAATVREAIAGVVADAVNQAAESMRWIRDYIDELDGSAARCEKRHDTACSVCVERSRIAKDIRRLLPAVPEAAGEVEDVAEDRDL